MDAHTGALEERMKRICFFICLNCLSLFLFARGNTLIDHSRIKELSSFTVMGQIDLRTEKDYSAEIKYRTLNHEGGMKVTVLENLKTDIQKNESGKWLYVLLTSPMWVESGEWIKEYQKFLIFLPDNMPVFDFEE